MKQHIVVKQWQTRTIYAHEQTHSCLQNNNRTKHIHPHGVLVLSRKHIIISTRHIAIKSFMRSGVNVTSLAASYCMKLAEGSRRTYGRLPLNCKQEGAVTTPSSWFISLYRALSTSSGNSITNKSFYKHFIIENLSKANKKIA